jgi:hypothetical protein
VYDMLFVDWKQVSTKHHKSSDIERTSLYMSMCCVLYASLRGTSRQTVT